MPIPPVDPITIATTGITTTIRIFEITYQLKAVGPQTADLLKTIERVNRNIKEAQRLRQQKADMLRREEIEWMDGIIQDTLDARLAMARLIEPVRIDQQTKNSISLVHRALWVLRDKPDVVNKHRKLTAIHQSLTSVIACLYSKDAIVITPVPDTSATQQLSPPPYDPEMAEFFERRTSRKQRRGISSLEDGRQGSANSSESIPSGGNRTNYTTPLYPSPAPVAQGPGDSGPRTSQIQLTGFGLSEAALWASDDLNSVFVPNSGPTSPGYLDKSAAVHALQHLNLANSDNPPSTHPPRPPKIPLSGAESQSNDIVERATVENSAKREELENNYTTSSYRRPKTSWLAYHATRSDAGHSFGGSSCTSIRFNGTTPSGMTSATTSGTIHQPIASADMSLTTSDDMAITGKCTSRIAQLLKSSKDFSGKRRRFS